MRTLLTPLLVAVLTGAALAATPTPSAARFHLATFRLTQKIEEIRRETGATQISVAFHDHQSGRRFTLAPDEWYAAASMVKLPVMVAVLTAVQQCRFRLDTPVRIFNQFRSIVTGAPYRISRSSELDPRFHDRIGTTMTIAELCHWMIASSSNLGTNVLIETIGLDHACRSFAALGIPGIQFRRGLGDQWASDAGIANRITAAGYEELLSRIARGQVISPEACQRMLTCLFGQRIRSGIPAGLPPSARARVAHKTGCIATVEHDGGLVYLPGRKPYVLVVLTRWPGHGDDHERVLALVTRAVHEALVDRL